MATASDMIRMYQIILKAEKKFQRELTESARNLLMIPIIELINIEREYVDWKLVELSISKLVQSAKPDIYTTPAKFNSRSIIRTFRARFCNIPPFCGPLRPARSPRRKRRINGH